ncbi:hypothetical protein PCANC_08550 [Puccinia coronata f. sp. avenae]|uniref:Uncharacterized protein n=1 Tax=Puccinia coronata f. sp. avenae TaxID=200324 RepID=A0A2N5TD12_9BASI|nr:hypothetical protein PCASD_11885 [Puccinia coronata f. sp. avenae]PLW34505.1 hypothetical protein PCASD_09793 [Puccinia coronata f. sp. avenae]PLW43983.1 hypothetical protein PCANC_08550 [Puccinia coronata f. sp. avenae]
MDDNYDTLPVYEGMDPLTADTIAFLLATDTYVDDDYEYHPEQPWDNEEESHGTEQAYQGMDQETLDIIACLSDVPQYDDSEFPPEASGSLLPVASGSLFPEASDSRDHTPPSPTSAGTDEPEAGPSQIAPVVPEEPNPPPNGDAPQAAPAAPARRSRKRKRDLFLIPKALEIYWPFEDSKNLPPNGHERHPRNWTLIVQQLPPPTQGRGTPSRAKGEDEQSR